MKKLAYIDALRGLAILGVLLVHTSQFGDNNFPTIISKVIGDGARGVQLFYIASAFTLFLSFNSRLSAEKFPIRNFFIRRFFRIAPIYYLGIIYYLFQDGFGSRHWLGDELSISPLNIFSNFTFLHGFNPYYITSVVPGGWSIAVEMTFYSLLPFLFSRIKSFNDAFNFFNASILLKFFLQLFFMKFNFISDSRLWNEYLFLYFPSQLPIFGLGIIFYFIVYNNEQKNVVSGKSILLFSLLLLIQFSTRSELIFSHHILCGIALLLLAVALSKYKLFLLVNPVVNYIGKISFSMYLVHFAVLHWLVKGSFVNYYGSGILNFSIRYLLVTLISIIISTILFNLIELPFQNIGKRIIEKIEERKQ